MTRWDVVIVEASGRAAERAHRLRRELERYGLSVRLVLVPPPAEPSPETFEDTVSSVVLLPHGHRQVAFLLFDRSRRPDVESGSFFDRDVEPLARYVAARLGRTERAIEVHVDTDGWKLLYGRAALQYELERAWVEPEQAVHRLDLARPAVTARTPLAVIQRGSAIAVRPELVEGIAWLLARPPLLEGMTTAEVAAAVEAFVRLHGPERRRGVPVALWHAGEPELRTSIVLDRAFAERVRALEPVPVSQLDRRVLVERVVPAVAGVVVRQARGLDPTATRKLMDAAEWRVGGP